MLNSAHKYDYIIVGQGIAGSILSFTLIEQGQKVLVVDPCKAQTTSLVAAGLFNPITGRKPTKTWLAEELFPFLHHFYPRLEKALNAKFFYPTPIFVPFDSVEKQNNWLSRSAEPGYPQFIAGFEKHKYDEQLHAKYGGITLQRSGYIHTPTLIHSYREYLKAQNSFLKGSIDYNDIELHEAGVKWGNYEAKKMIFCEGIQNRLNPFFSWLDYRPAKGEILKIALEGAAFSEIINRGCWLIRQTDGFFKVGSNFERSTDPSPSERGLSQVLEKLKALTPLTYQVLEHHAGIRPATYDRRPFIGIHPEHKQLALFGGLGSKGTSLAPYFANMLTRHLLEGKPIIEAVRLDRKRK